MITSMTRGRTSLRNQAMTAVIAGVDDASPHRQRPRASAPPTSSSPAARARRPGPPCRRTSRTRYSRSIALADEPVAIQDRQLRMRRLEIQPGGVVPWHSHEDRPAIIYVVQGEVTEYSSECAAPIVHMTGEVSVETHGVAHWWKNTGAGTVVLISADLLRAEDDANTM